MSYLLFTIKNAIDDLKLNRARTFLTALGILIGIASVILLLSFGLGLKKYIAGQFESIGKDLIMVLPGRSFQGGLRPGAGTLGGARFDLNDIKKLKRIDSLSAVAPGREFFAKVSSYGESAVYDIIATSEEAFEIFNFEIDRGELFRSSNVQKASKVVVLGAGPAEKIFGGAENAVGKIAKIDDQAFKVIGVSRSKGGGRGLGPTVDDLAFIPHTASLSINPSKKFIAIYAKAKSDEVIEKAKADIEAVLLERYSEDDFTVIDQREMLDIFSSVFNTVNLVLVAIGAISLVVGGVGIMNIMYVSVSEKTKEIGIRRSIGATKKDVLAQFLTEAVMLSMAGGILGLLLSFIVVYFIQRYFPAYINLTSVLLAIGVSSIIGFVFGVLPAKRAADMSPIEAIRYE